MNGTRIRKAAVCLVAALSLAGGLAISASAAGRPAGMSKAAYAALMARSQALNERYGNAYTSMSPAEYRAIYLRSVALNRLYHLGDFAQPVKVAAPPAAADGGFDRTDVMIGTAALLGLVLLAAGAFGATHSRWHLPVTHGR
jgi:hypothetical protein